MIYKTKETVLMHLHKGANFSNKCFDLFRNNREVVLTALRHDTHYKIIPIEFRNDKEMAETLLSNIKYQGLDYLDLQSIGFELLADSEFIWLMMAKVPYESLATSLYLASGYGVKYDFDICTRLVVLNPESICLIPHEIKKDFDILESFASQMGYKKYRDLWTRRIVEELELPQVDNDEMVRYVKSLRMNSRLESSLKVKKENAQLVKI